MHPIVVLLAPLLLSFLISDANGHPQYNITKQRQPRYAYYRRHVTQDLIPLGYSSSDDEEGSCELPNGRLVCGPHGLVVCPRCSTDYSFIGDDLDDDDQDLPEEEDEYEEVDLGRPERISRVMNWSDEMVRGTGKVFPSKFVPSNSDTAPLDEFPNRHQHIGIVRRTHFLDHRMVLLMTDGACLNNGRSNPRAGWAFFQGETLSRELLIMRGRLENEGPWGDAGCQTSNRAELRAVIAALRFRHWRGEGFRTVVVATDSSYVVEGATQWTKKWVRNGWKTMGQKGSGGGDVKNKDLWEALLGECERAEGFGMAIQFWKIPREWNTSADEGAKKAAAEGDALDHWQDVTGQAF